MTEQLLYTAAANFESARRVSLLPEEHRLGRLHGHSFGVEVRCLIPPNWADFPGGEVQKLAQILSQTIGPLDYNHLNQVLDQPTNENLARWIRSRLDVPEVENIRIQSTPCEGVDLDHNDHAHIWRRYAFESAHQLPNVPIGHKCGRMHGHSFQVVLHADQNLKGGVVDVDYDHLDKVWMPIHAELDYTCLNDVLGLQNPTSEVISAWIWQKLKAQLPELSGVTVYETATSGAHYDGQHYRIWKELTLDSSLQLKRAPEGDKRRRIHGHTYTLQLHLHASLDQVMGWIVDFGDVKELFTPIFKRLDHHPLHELEGLSDCDAASLAYWIREQANPLLPQLKRIDLYETRGCGAILTWGGLDPVLLK